VATSLQQWSSCTSWERHRGQRNHGLTRPRRGNALFGATHRQPTSRAASAGTPPAEPRYITSMASPDDTSQAVVSSKTRKLLERLGAPTVQEGGDAPLFRFSDSEARTGYWFLWRRAARPGPTSGLEAEGAGPGGAGGMEKLPAATRANSSWFSWFALVPVISDGGCAFSPWWCVEARACRCVGGSADVVPPGTGTPGTIPVAAGRGDAGYPDCGVPGMPGDPCGRLYSGEEGPGPPGGLTAGPVPVPAVAPGPLRCAQPGAATASAATIATPLKRYFMTLILRCSSALTRLAPFCSGTTR